MILKDAELVQQVLQGNQEAFGCLVKKYQKGVHTLAWRKIGDFHIAQEITQDAFLKAYQKFKIIAFAGATLYVATDKGVIYSREGTDWHETAGVDGAMLIIDKFAMDGTTVYGISDIHAHPARHVYQLKENSNTWKQVTPEIPNRVTSLVVEGSTLYIGTIGRGVLRFTLSE